MIVYRICNKDEIQKIFNEKSFNNVGKEYTINPKLNTHMYEKGRKYLHFFKNYDSVFYMHVTNDYYICTYDIPGDVLDDKLKIGYYLNRIFMKKLEKVIEYAIPCDEILFDYLLEVDKIIDDIEFEDYLDNNFYDKLETIYQVSEKKYLKLSYRK